MADGRYGPGMGAGDEPRRIDREERGAEALDRYWDGLVQRGGVHLGGLATPDADPIPGVEAALAVAVRRLHTGDDAPAPSPDFAARLRRDLFEGRAVETGGTVAAMPGAEAGATRSLGLVHPLLGWRSARRAVTAVAAAVVLALIGGLDLERLVPGLVGPTPTVAAEERMLSPAADSMGCRSTATPAGVRDDLPRAERATATAAAGGGGGQGCEVER